MKKQISLKLFVTLAFLLLGGTLVIGYSILSSHYFRMGMSTLKASEMEGIAKDYIDSQNGFEKKVADNSQKYQIWENWNDLPMKLREKFENEEAEPGLSIKSDKAKWYHPHDGIYFVFRYQENARDIFVVGYGNKATAPPLIGDNARKSFQRLLALSLSIAAIMGGVIVLLLRRVSRPAAALGQWARSLRPDNLGDPPPDFSYPELNELAELIKDSLSSVQESLEREHTFLRHASHELRTPIAVIRNNVELLHRVKSTLNVEANPHLEKAVDRIDRAGHNMQYLTETLLWLSRKEAESLPTKNFALNVLVEELVKEMRYLLHRKDIKLSVDTTAHSVCLPEYAVRIVLGNLMRNAFQHTWQGSISIRQQEGRVDFINSHTFGDREKEDLGFGLGLQLTDQLTQKMGWKCADTSNASQHQVSIIFAECESNTVSD